MRHRLFAAAAFGLALLGVATAADMHQRVIIDDGSGANPPNPPLGSAANPGASNDAGTAVTGAVMPTGGAGLTGWLSGLFYNLIPMGIAGSPSAQIVTVQGVAAQTPQRVMQTATALSEGATSLGFTSTGVGGSMIAKSTAGNYYGANAVGAVGLSGYRLVIYDNVAIPVIGAALNLGRVKDCIAFDATGSAKSNTHLPPRPFAFGIVALVTSGTDCTSFAGVVSYTASVTANTAVLNVSAVASGALAVGQSVNCAACYAGQTIISLGTGTGGTGTYNLSQTQVAAVASEAMIGALPAAIFVDYQ